MRITRIFAALLITSGTLWVGCGGNSSNLSDSANGGGAAKGPSGSAGLGHAGFDSTGNTSGAAGTADSCLTVGSSCHGGPDCCSGVCDPNTGCVSAVTTCAGAGNACAVASDCCSLSCVGGKCSTDQCVSDGQACTTNDQCCGGNCGADKTCTALNSKCSTAGNECASNGDCCSGLCDAGKHCALSASFCIQPGDSCGRDSDCCTATCTIAAGHTVGSCAAPPTGPSYCTKVDGMLCGGCGDCCSRLCAPGPGGVDICQPASGCHVTGDLCLKDTDCCGGDKTSGLPGAGNGSCHIEAGAKIGICTNPVNGGGNACNPEGNVCHYLADPGYACTSSSARSDCCGPETPKAQMCKLDSLGVPRCFAGGDCHKASDVCAAAADCCNNAPCVPDDTGALHCAAVACIPTGGGCTINGDCCPGGICNRPVGSTVGSCATTTTPPTGGSGGASSGGSGGSAPTAGTAGTAGTPGTCALYGQICAQDGDCCDGIPCTNGQCVVVVK